MPFSLIPTVLGVSFAFVWLFIGGMILRDGQFAVRRDREIGVRGEPAKFKSAATPRPHARFTPRRQLAGDRVPAR
jgi:hypothetical protein